MIDVIVILFIIGIMFLCLNVIISNLVQNAIDKNLVNSKAMKRYKIFNKITSKQHNKCSQNINSITLQKLKKSN
jgi:hypothetical protein